MWPAAVMATLMLFSSLPSLVFMVIGMRQRIPVILQHSIVWQNISPRDHVVHRSQELGAR